MSKDRYCGGKWLDEAARQACEEIGAELGEPKDEISFSCEHEKKMQSLFKRSSRSVVYSQTFRLLRRAACFLLVFAAVSGSAIFGVNAWRSRFLVVDFDENAIATTFENGLIISECEENDDYEISVGYVPNGMECILYDSTDGMCTAYYVNDDNECLIIDVTPAGSAISVDSEDGFMEYVTVDGCEAVYIQTAKNLNTVLWYNNSLCYTVQGNFSKETLMKVAENVNKK